MDLREGLSALSKSSPYAVTTDNKIESPEFDAIKRYLFVETEIEKEFNKKLQILKHDEILFLCGSSGDGKSEILTRYSAEYKDKIVFHLDATHSFQPKLTAIDTLNEVFTKFNKSECPLVIGINIGMLGNYAEEGIEEHVDIRQSIKTFLDTKEADQISCYFIDFEAFPKFTLSADIRTSEFLKKLFIKITAEDVKNPLYKLYQAETKDKVLRTNYKLFSIPEIQDSVIELLLKARLEKDQFITARSLLDFVHILLTGPAYFFDNLFNDSDNELGKKIIDFDPCATRGQELDMFILQQQLGLQSESFDVFSAELSTFGIEYDLKAVNKYSLIRLFYLLKEMDFSNNFHHVFNTEFNDQLIQNYAKYWNLNNSFKGGRTEKAVLKKFYKDVILASINCYANRNTRGLHNDEFFVSSHGDWQLTAELELNADYLKISDNKEVKISSFNVYIKVGDKELKPFSVSINLLDLMYRIVRGYRPNKHDKNTVVQLDEIIEQIVDVGNSSKTLYLHKGKTRIKLKEVDEEDIEVGEA